MSYVYGNSSRTVTAFFDTREAAENAVRQLTAFGVPKEQVRLTAGAEGSAGVGATDATAGKGFWEELKDMFLPAEDRNTYAEGLRRGGYLVSATVADELHDRAVEALDADGSVNMDEREANWRASGWQGDHVESAVTGAAVTANATGAAAAMSTPSLTTPTSAASLQTSGDEVIPVYEETAKIGKRDISHGRVRLRTYVVETPITEQVNLRSEQVQVERRPVDRIVEAGDAVFQDRVIEAEERAEEAVIGKETRVKEEISLRKTVENQTQSVSETLRHTEVEVQDERGGTTGAARKFVATTDSSTIAAHMDVIASDGVKIGTVDHLDGDKIKLAKSTSADGQHHFIPLAYIDHVDTHVHLKETAAAAKQGW